MWEECLREAWTSRCALYFWRMILSENRCPLFRIMRLARAHHRLQIVVGLDDLDQAILGRAIAAIGIGVMLLHQRLVLGLDVVQRRIRAEPHHLQRLALGVEHFAGFDLGLGAGARPGPPATAAVEFAEHAERIGSAFQIGFGAALALLGSGVGAPLPGWAGSAAFL